MNTPVGGIAAAAGRHPGAHRAGRPRPPAARPRRRSRSAGTPPATTSASPATAATRTARSSRARTGTSFSFTGLTCGTSYTLAVDAYDAAGNRSTRPSISASTSACSPAPDTQAPTAPAGLAASGQTQTQITLSWNASSDNVGVTGYSRYQNGTLVSSGTGTSFNFTGLTCGTSYTLAVDAYDAAGNRSTRPSISASTLACSAGTGPVAAYSFDTATGTSLTDNSGSGNTGSISGATWTSAGKSGGALAFDGVNDIVTVADKASLDLSTANDARGLDPPDRQQHLADDRHQGDERQPDLRPVLELRCSAAERDRLHRRQPGSGHHSRPDRGRDVELDASRIHLRRRRASAVRQRHPGLDHERDRCDGQLGRPAPDRWQQRLGGMVPGPDRRPPRLQPCPHAEPAPDRHEHAGRTAAGRRHAGTVGSGRPGRQRPDADRADAVLERLDRQRRRHRLQHLPQHRRSRHDRPGDPHLHLHRPHLRNRLLPRSGRSRRRRKPLRPGDCQRHDQRLYAPATPRHRRFRPGWSSAARRRPR